MELGTSEDVKPQRVTKEVWVIVERAPLQKALWIRIGSAWENRDGSIKVLLNALPISGEVLIRDPRPFEESRRTGPLAA